jgi:hypothetical protein
LSQRNNTSRRKRGQEHESENEMPNSGNYITPEELSQRYRGEIKIRTLANWRASGDGPPFTKIGGRVLYHRDGVENWEKRRTKGDR